MQYYKISDEFCVIMKIMRLVPVYIGKTYFFKGKSYWEFNDSLMHVTHSRPALSAPRWMDCPRTTMHLNEVIDEDSKEPLVSHGYRATHTNSNLLFITICAILFTFIWQRNNEIYLTVKLI